MKCLMLLIDVSYVICLTTLAAIILSYGKGNEFVCREVNHGISHDSYTNAWVVFTLLLYDVMDYTHN